MTGAQARATIRSRFVPPAEPEPVAEVRDETIPRAPAATSRSGSTGRTARGSRSSCTPTAAASCSATSTAMTDCAATSPIVFPPLSFRWPTGWRRRIGGRQQPTISIRQPDGPLDNAAAVGGDARRVVVGGDSAGGNLAAVTALMARDRGGPPLAAQLLIYPVIAADFDNESYRLFGKGFYNPTPALQWYWDQYVPAAADREHPYASPLTCRPGGTAARDRRRRRPRSTS